MSTWVILAFVIYMIFMLGIGIITARKNKSSDDYFLGGRNLGGWVTALSAQASDMSGWMLMGLPGCVYAFGANQAWIAIGLLIGTILNWVIVAGRLRRYTIKAGNAMTIPEYLSNRFRDKHNILITISAIVIVIFFVVYSASAFASGGKLFASITKMDYHQALIVGAVVILIYTFLGGLYHRLRTGYDDAGWCTCCSNSGCDRAWHRKHCTKSCKFRIECRCEGLSEYLHAGW